TEEGLQAISATINGHEKLITEDSLRRNLKLDDAEGISLLSNEEIFEHLAHIGYVTNSKSSSDKEGEKYEFQNYELKCKEIKINNLNLELKKVVKGRDELKLKIEKWEESSKNLDELLNSQMSARDKTGLGYGTQLNEMSNKSETDSEISMSVFEVRSSDKEFTPTNDRFSKADGYHAVPPPITGNFLTPRADISFAGKTNETNTQKPKTVYESVNRDKVIIEDWNSDDEDDVSEVQTVSPVKTNETQTGNLEIFLQDHAVVDSGCSIHMTRNKAYLSEYEDYNGGFVAFGVIPTGGDLDFVSFREMITSQLQGKLWLYDEVHQPNVTGTGLDWMFDLDFLTNTMNYIPVSVENQVVVDAGTQESYVAGSLGKDNESTQEYILLLVHPLRTRSLVEAVVQYTQEKPSENASKDKNVQDSKDDAE
ncbi:hypothetical protein Tco_0855624, partial [Tanacetum coccineum]